MLRFTRHPLAQRAAFIVFTLGLLTSAVILGYTVNQRGAHYRALHESVHGSACNYMCTLTTAQQNHVWYRRFDAVQTLEISVHD